MILIDSHVVIWLGTDPGRISAMARQAIAEFEESGDRGCISAVTLYEVADNVRRGRVLSSVSADVLLAKVRSRFDVLPVTGEIASRAAEFAALFPKDPMDRLITATAVVENCTLITADRKILASKVCKTLW
jgi:PIN domain nuclease of toxin-antitoxin system